MKVLVIEDDAITRDYISKGFREEGHVVDSADNGQDGLMMAMSGEHELIILDRMLPGGLDGMRILAVVRASGADVPVLVLSALDSVDERVRGLREGGNDYLVKPFAFAELLARAELLIRRPKAGLESVVTELHVGPLVINQLSREVQCNGSPLRLQPREYSLLLYMAENADQVVTRTRLFEKVWEYHFDPGTNVIDVHIARLRKKLELAGAVSILKTVRGAGYMIRSES